MSMLDDVHREALRDWLDNRPPRDLPTPAELLSDPDAWNGVDVDETLAALAGLALTPEDR